MGKAIKINNANFASRGLGQVHWCKYDISYCTIYKYLIGDSNSWIELDFKRNQVNITKVWAKIVTESASLRAIFGQSRYVNSTDINLTGVLITDNKGRVQGTNAMISWYDSSNTVLSQIGACKPHTGIDQCIECYSKLGSHQTGTTLKWYQNGELKVNSQSTSNVATRNDDYNLTIMAGYNSTTFAKSDNGVYVSRIYYEDVNNQADPSFVNDDVIVGMPLDLIPCQLNRDIDGSLAWDGNSHSAGECGFVNFFNGKFYGSTTATKGFSVSNY